MVDLRAFSGYLREHDSAVLTITGYVTDVRLFAKWFEQTTGEAFAAPAVTPGDVRDYKQFLLTGAHRKASTINRKLAALSAFMRFALETHVIEQDPTAQIKWVEEAPRGPKYLDKQQKFALQRAVEKDLQYAQARYPKRWLSRRRDGALVLFLWHTGLRVSELLGLTKRDVQLSERKGQIRVNGKGTKQRTIPLNAEARRALTLWLDVRPVCATEHIWLDVVTETALTARTVQRVLKRYGRAAHIEHLTPHVLRHTFGKSLIDAQVSIEQVAALLGHSNLNTTRLYLTPSEHDLTKAVEKIEVH